MKAWLEGDFHRSVEKVIAAMGGRTDRIENRAHPGNADTLYSLSTMGVIECKATKEWKEHCKIRLRHPLSADQRRFLREHGQRSGNAWCAVMLSTCAAKGQEVLFFRWDNLQAMDHHALRIARERADWAGLWPPRGNKFQELKSMLNGEGYVTGSKDDGFVPVVQAVKGSVQEGPGVAP